jgi:hypothetical protein
MPNVTESDKMKFIQVGIGTYWSCGIIPGSADEGVMGVIGLGVAGPIFESVTIWLEGVTIGDIRFC